LNVVVEQKERWDGGPLGQEETKREWVGWEEGGSLESRKKEKKVEIEEVDGWE
jgi:hypothetical protein